MKILITGATGFVGQNLIPQLSLHRPQDIMLLLVRDIEKAGKLYSKQQYPNIVIAESYDFDSVINFSPEIVLHLAAFSTSSDSSEIIEQLINSNITFGVKLLDCLKKCNNLKLFINTGSAVQYRLGTESQNDAYLYGATKSAFINFLNYYSDVNNFKYVNVIPFSVYGGIMTVKRIMDYMIESLSSNTPIDMTPGEQILDFIHIDDLVDFYITLIDKTQKVLTFNNGINFFCGTGKGTSLRDLAKIVEKVYNKKTNINWGGRMYRERDTMYSVAPIGKNLELLNWCAKIDLESGIRIMKEKNNCK